MNYCTQCGYPNEDDARFCVGCGASLKPPAAPVSDPYDGGSMQSLYSGTAPVKKSKAPMIAAISAAVLLVGGGTTAFLLRDRFTGGGEEPSSQVESEEEELDEKQLEKNLSKANDRADSLLKAANSALVDMDCEDYTAEDGFYLFDEAYTPDGDAAASDAAPDDCDYLLYRIWQYDEKLEKLDGFGFYVEDMCVHAVIVDYKDAIGSCPAFFEVEDLGDAAIDEDTLQLVLDEVIEDLPVETEIMSVPEPVTEPETEPETSSSASGISDDDPTLSIVCWTDYDLGYMMDAFCAQYPEYTDCVQYVHCGESGYSASESYRAFLNSGEDVDLFLTEPGWAQQYINSYDYALPLSVLNLTEEDFSDAYGYTLQMGTNADGELMAVTWNIAPGGFCYYTDIAEQYLGVVSPEELQAMIGDWDGFTEVASVLAAHDITVCASLAGMWTAYSSSCTGIVQNGEIDFGNKMFEFTDLAQQYIMNGYVDPTITQWDGNWFDEGKNGETFGYFFPAWALGPNGTLETCMGSEGNINIVLGPQAYYWGGSQLCVSSHCNSASMAEAFVRSFTVDQASMEDFALDYGYYMNSETVMEGLYYENPLLGGQDEIAVLLEAARCLDLAGYAYYDQPLKDTFFNAFFEDSDDTAAEIQGDFLEDAVTLFPELY